MMETLVPLAGLPLAIGVSIFAHQAGRRWWAWLLLCAPMTPIGAAVVLCILERAFIKEKWRATHGSS